MIVLSVLLSFSFVQTKLARIITSKVNTKYNTTILVEKVDLSSLRNVELKNVLIKDHHHDTLIFVENLKTSFLNFKKITDNNLKLGKVTIEKGVFVLKTYKGEETNNLTIFSRKFQNEEENENTFKLTSSSIYVNELDFILIEENKKSTPIVFYKHIGGFFNDFKIEGANVSTSIRHLKTIENHKINIVDFGTDFSYTNTKMEFLQTHLKTKKSNIEADVILNYEEGGLLNFTDKVQIDAVINKGEIVLSDLKKAYNEFGEKDKIYFTTHAKGTVNNFVLENLDLKSDKKSSFKGTIELKDILHSNKFKMDANIKQLSTDYNHLTNLFPKLLGDRIPPSTLKLGHFTSRGNVLLTKTNVQATLVTKSEIGKIIANLNLTNFDKKEEALYEGKMELINFGLGKFVGDSLIGELSMIANIRGKGFSINSLNINIDGTISKHQYKGYTYTNIDVNGVLENKHFNGELVVNDPNIQLVFNGLADLSTSDYIFDFKADVAFADFYTLNLFTRDKKSVLKGIIEMDLHGSNLDNIEGEIRFKNASYSNQIEKYNFKDFLISSKIEEDIREVKIISADIIDGSIKGNFKFKELKKLSRNSLGSLYVNYEKVEVSKGQFLNFDFDIHNKIIEVFFPKIQLGVNTIIRGEINADDDIFKLTVKSPTINAYDFLIDDIKLQIDNKNPIFNTLLSVKKVDAKQYNIADVDLVNVVLNDTLFIRTNFKGGKELKEDYNLSFYHTINEEKKSVFGIKKSEVTFKNTLWNINPNNNNHNKFIFEELFTTFTIDTINMVSNNQQFINLSGYRNGKVDADINLKFKNVNLYDITPSIDSIALGGKVNGTIGLKNIEDKILPFADLEILEISVNKDNYGDLTLDASGDEFAKNYVFETRLNHSNFISFYSKGSVDFKEKKPIINAEAKFDKFRIGAFNPLGKGILDKIRGIASGEIAISGFVENPIIEGEIILKDAGIKVPYLNVNYDFLGDAKVKLYDQTFDFQSITIQDNLMLTMGTINGTITHTNFKKWQLNLKVETDDLLVLNTEETEESLYYGTGLIAGEVTLIGPTDNMFINIVGSTNLGTKFILPLSDVSTVNESKLIHFESEESIKEEENEDTILFEKLKGLSIDFDLEVTKDAVAQVVIDKKSGSILKGSGDGNIKLDIDMNGKFEMYGTLIIDNGEYQFRNIVNKDFEVVKGGTVIWNGDPFDAELNITAVNHTKANPAVLLDEIASSRKIDVDLLTNITGDLSNPVLEFDVQIPNSSSLVASELEFKLSNEDDMLTQFISLLVTGAFSDTSQDKTNFDSSAALAGTISQKATQLITSVLGDGNENFQVEFTYDIGTDNDVKDVTTDDQLGFEISSRIGDKVIVNGKVGVPVGSNTSSNVIGEVEIIVPLNEAETFQGKVYNRQNEIEFDVADGEGYTQGIGLSYRFDFDNGKEFLEKVGVKKTEAEKLLTKDQRDSIKKEKKLLRKQTRNNKKQLK